MHSYLRHTILMFNPTNIDGVCVQATHIESRGENVKENFSKKLAQPVEGKHKGRCKLKQITTLKEEDENPSCSHWKKEGNVEAKC